MSRRRIILLVAACLLAHAATGIGQETALDRVWELRRDGAWPEALVAARSYRDTLTGDDPVAAEQVADAERLVATVESVLALPPDGLRAVTRADSLRQAVLEAFDTEAYEPALADLERELELRRRWQGEDHADVGRTLYLQGHLHSQLGNDAEAEASFAQAAGIQRRALGAGHSATMRTRRYVANYRYRAEDYAAAGEVLEELLPAYESLYGREHPSTFGALDQLATIADLLGEERRAAGMREECAELTRAHYGADHPQTAAVLRRLASSQEKLGHLDASVATHEESLAILRRAGKTDGPSYANGLAGLALVLQRQGDLERAEPLHRQALVVAREAYGERHAWIARFLGNLAFLAEAQGRYAESAELYREALAIQREQLPPTSPQLALTLDNMASLECARGRPAAALPLYEEALSIRRAALGENHANVARALSHLAEAQTELDQLDPAEANLAESLAIRREIYGDDHPMVAVALSRQADVARRRGDWATADSLLTRTLAMRRAWLGDHHREVGRTLLDLAEVKLAQGETDQAAELLAAAAASHEDARLRAGRGLTRATSRLANPYRLQAALALEQDETVTAWLAVEKLRARALTDILAAGRERRLAPQDAAREDSLRRRLLDSEQRLLAVRQAGAAREAGRLRREHEETAAAWAVLRQELSAADPAGAGRILPADSVRHFLGEGEALVGWFDGECPPGTPRRWAYLATGTDDPTWIRLPAPADTTDATATLRRLLRDPATPRTECADWQRRVHAERLTPLMPRLAGVARLVVVPGDALLGVPVETLMAEDGQAAGTRFTVSYVPSATALAQLRRQSAARKLDGLARGLLLGDPPYCADHLLAMNTANAAPETYRGVTGLAAVTADPARGLTDSLLAALPRVAATRTEVETIAGILPASTVLLGAEASEQELAGLVADGRLSNCDLVHLATHAIVDDEQPGRSALVLARTTVDDPLARALTEGRIYDGLLTADEIVAEWQLDAELVVLSACETGLGRRVAGEGYIGFTHAFLEAGARAVLVSLWPVDDRSTSLLMARFYENLLGSYDDERGAGPGAAMGAATALTEAKRHVRGLRHRGRRAYEHPFYWSPFVLIGVVD